MTLETLTDAEVLAEVDRRGLWDLTPRALAAATAMTAEGRREYERIVRPQLIRRRRKPRGLRHDNRKLSEATIARIRELRAGGMSQNKTAQELGIAQGTVRRYMREEKTT